MIEAAKTISARLEERIETECRDSLADEFGPKPWTLRTRLAYAKKVSMRVFIYGDTNNVRVELGVSSVFFAFGLFPFLNTFDRAPFRYMTFMPWWCWVVLLLAHAVGVAWRQADTKPSIIWGLIINGFGLFLWLSIVGLLTAGVGEYSPGMAVELCLILRAIVAICRTGLNNEDISP